MSTAREDPLYIVIDVGNSGAKIGAVRGENVAGPRRLGEISGRAVRAQAEPLLQGGAQAVFVVYGSDPGKVKDLAWEVGKLRLGDAVVLDGKHRGLPPARVAQPERAGLDRRVQVLGAARLAGGPVAVVSCGTALTVDMGDETGSLLGGAILPGLTLGMRALAAATASLPVVDLAGEVEVPGRDTATAIRSGILVGAAGAVERLLGAFADSDGVTLFLTGQDAGLLGPRLERTHRRHPGLGLYGAAVAAREAGELGRATKR
ncbi:MAG: type III pantothenate kinase [Planctomycetota bacterium]